MTPICLSAGPAFGIAVRVLDSRAYLTRRTLRRRRWGADHNRVGDTRSCLGLEGTFLVVFRFGEMASVCNDESGKGLHAQGGEPSALRVRVERPGGR